MVPERELVERFSRDLEAVTAPDARLGIAVSGGPDSLALLLLAAAARPGRIEAASVDHALREGSRDEAVMVGAVCASLDVPHVVLTVKWQEKPATRVQERAREERYALLAHWAHDRHLDAVVTGHHLDDQAETLLMRLARGSGVRGLSGMRPRSLVPGSDIPLLRPLLGWRRSELADVCERNGLQPASDPSNEDEQFERVRLRRALAQAEWLDPRSLASTAANLRAADEALQWAVEKEWDAAVTNGSAGIAYRPTEAPSEIRRRIVSRAVLTLGTEGECAELRGRELDRLLRVLAGGKTATIRGVRCTGGAEWRFVKAPARRR
jgi:tRNA(Ile)-lysidine synthase